jgi:hypothetical protein
MVSMVRLLSDCLAIRIPSSFLSPRGVSGIDEFAGCGEVAAGFSPFSVLGFEQASKKIAVKNTRKE